MRSTFMGLETNKRGLYTQQSALHTTGHNISNANTLGYSRQRVNMQATPGYPGVGLNAGTMPGFLGTGVEAGSIQRIRDGFVDHQYRQETNKLGYWESRSQAISQMEDVLNEPSEYGLQKTLSEFWASLQDLAVNPENGGARAVVVERGVTVADSFNHMHKSLTEIQTNLGTEINFATGHVNSILQQISELNAQIQQVEPNGYLPNDLYDARDMLVDELSTYFPVDVEYGESGGRALAIAEGPVKISLKTTEGLVTLVDGNKSATLQANPVMDGTNNPITGFTIIQPDGTIAANTGHANLYNLGKMKSLMNSFGTSDGKGLYPEMLAKLDRMAAVFAKEFNKVHKDGFPTAGPQTTAENFFVINGIEISFTAANLKVNDEIIEDNNLLRASTFEDEEGNGKNASNLGNVQFTAFTGANGLDGATIQAFFQGIIGQLGVDGQQAERQRFNTETLRGAVEHRRASISSVSLDEEMTDMIRFQQAYNASARMITVVDETLDKIINGMGVVGR